MKKLVIEVGKRYKLKHVSRGDLMVEITATDKGRDGKTNYYAKMPEGDTVKLGEEFISDAEEITQ